MFHLIPADGGPTLELRTRDLKGLFFVREFVGNKTRKDVRGFIAGPQETGQGKKIAVLFKDGELMCGYSCRSCRTATDSSCSPPTRAATTFASTW